MGLTKCSLPGNCYISFLESYFRSTLGCTDSRVYSLPELSRPDEEKMFFLVGRDEDVVLVLALLPGPIFEGRHTVTIFTIVVPLSLVLETIRALADAKATSLVILPLAHVGLCHVGIQQLILQQEESIEDKEPIYNFISLTLACSQSLKDVRMQL